MYDKASNLLRKSITLDPENSAEACNYLGYMWAEHNMNLEEAELIIRHALQSEPGNESFMVSLGWRDYRSAKVVPACSDLLRTGRTYDRVDPRGFEQCADH